MKIDIFLRQNSIILQSTYISILIIGFIIWGAKLRVQKKLSNTTFWTIILLVILSIILNVLRADDGLLGASTESLAYIMPAFIVAFLFYSVFVRNRTQRDIEQDYIDRFVKSLFNDGRFHSAFVTSLPKQYDEDDNGMEYMPLMLENIEERRKRFSKNARSFLTVTLILGGSFIFIVVFLGIFF